MNKNKQQILKFVKLTIFGCAGYTKSRIWPVFDPAQSNFLPWEFATALNNTPFSADFQIPAVE